MPFQLLYSLGLCDFDGSVEEIRLIDSHEDTMNFRNQRLILVLRVKLFLLRRFAASPLRCVLMRPVAK